MLEERTAVEFSELIRRLRAARGPQGARHLPLWRLHPERWLESLVVHDIGAVDERLNPNCVYAQVPAFSSSDRAMLDVLTITRDRRLAVLELKADEDIHLPLQGLDYWSRVQCTMPGVSFSVTDISPGTTFRRKTLSCFSWPPLCTFIPPLTIFCVTFPPTLIGR